MLKKVGEQVFRDYEQTKNMGVQEKANLESNTAMAVMNASVSGIDVDDIMMRTSSIDQISMKTSYERHRAGSRIEATLSEHHGIRKWPSSS